MNTKTHVSYSVRIAGQFCSFTPDRYSKYYDRLAIRDGLGGKTPQPDLVVYGPEQAEEHIEELRRHVYNGKKIYAETVFEIVRTVEESSVVKTVSVGGGS